MGWGTVPWVRRLVPLGAEAGGDRYGWPGEWGAEPQGSPLSQLRAVPVAVMCAERGVGKSFTLTQESEDLKVAGHQPSLLDLRQCANTGLSERKLAQAFHRPAAAGEWFVLLDGLDEGLDQTPSLGELIAERVESLSDDDRAALRLRISCRTIRWPARLEEDLRRLWRQTPDLLVWGLAALTRADVLTGARAAGLADPEEFADAVELRGLVALATHPVTLRHMLDGYTESGRLPDSAEQVYAEGCLRLCTETRRPTDTRVLSDRSTSANLVSVASRLAAAMQFGGYEALSDHSQPGTQDLELARLAVGKGEPDGVGGRVRCTMRELREVVESGLFVSVGDLRWVFAHHSYQEFLAARFLASRALPSASQRELLWIGDGASRHVIAAQQEVAAWRCTSDPVLFDDLVRDDPLVLQLVDLGARPAADRARAVDALLHHLADDDTATLQISTLHRLNHPGLSDQLRPYLRQSKDMQLLGAACIARACRPADIDDDLLALAENTDLDEEVRVAAVGGVTVQTGSNDGEVVVRLRALAGAESAEVAAVAVQQLWPQCIALEECLDLIPDPRPGYIGTAYVFRVEFPGLLNDADLPSAAQWALRTLSDANASGSTTLALSILARAVKAVTGVDDEALVASTGHALLALADRDEVLREQGARTSFDSLGNALSGNPGSRRVLTGYLFEHASAVQFHTLTAFLPSGSLTAHDDGVFWMTRWATLSATARELAASAVRIPRPDEPELLAQAEQARAAHPDLQQATAYWDGAPTPPSPRRRAIEQRRDKERQDRTYDGAAMSTALAAVRTAPVDQVRSAWWRVLRELLKTPDGSAASLGGPLTFVNSAPSRPAPGSSIEADLRSVAMHVLQTVPPLTATDFAPEGTDWSISTEIFALGFLGPGGLAQVHTSAPVWAGWAIAVAMLLTGDVEDTALQQNLLEICVGSAADDFTHLLGDVMPQLAPVDLRHLLHALAGAPKISGPTLRAWATAPDRTPDQWAQTLAKLASNADTHALALLRAELDTNPSEHPQFAPSRERWMHAVTVLMEHDPHLADTWTRIGPRLHDDTVVEDVLQHLANVLGSPGSWPACVASLREVDLQDLYATVVDHLGQDAAQPEAVTGFVGRPNRLRAMVQSLPQILARKNTAEAAASLHLLAERYPGIWQLRYQARQTARNAAARKARPVTPEDLLRLADDASLRWIADERQLHDVVREALTRFQNTLHGPNGTIVALWNRDQHSAGHRKWWPCWEEDLSDILASFLRQDIGGNRVIINREVQLRRSGLPGQRADILVEATAPHAAGDEPIKVIIECKGCWNDSLPTALAKQLVGDYLSTPRTAGIFLVGYFDCERWGTRKRGCPARAHTFSDVDFYQQQQVEQQRTRHGVTVSAFTMNCQLPGPSDTWREEFRDAPAPSTG